MMQCLKKRFSRPLVLAGLAASFTLALVATAHASTAYVGTSTIHTSTGGGTTVGSCVNVGCVPLPLGDNGGVNAIIGAATFGSQFINNTTSNVFGSAGTIRVVGANRLSDFGFQDGSGLTVSYNGLPVAAVFALEGSVAGGTASTFTATSGRIGFFTTSGFNVNNPLSWGAVNAAGTVLNAPIAVWDLKPSEQVIDLGPLVPSGGGPGIHNKLASVINKIDVNVLDPQDAQGSFLFRETTTYSGPAALSGNSYLTVIGNAPIPPPLGLIADEGLVASIEEHILANSILPIANITPAAGFAALNTIADILGGLGDLGGAGTAFATALGATNSSAGAGTDFNPTNLISCLSSPTPCTADLLFTLGASLSPTAQPIPEPATITLFIVGGLATCGMAGLRRFRGRRSKVRA